MLVEDSDEALDAFCLRCFVEADEALDEEETCFLLRLREILGESLQ